MVRLATGESVLERAVRILDVFSPEAPALLVTEVARRSGLHVATASRLIAELVELGLLARGDDRQVRVGVRLWELGLRASPTLSLRNAAMPPWKTCTRSSVSTLSSGFSKGTRCCSSSG